MVIFLYGQDGFRRIARKKLYAEEFGRRHPGGASEHIDGAIDGASEKLLSLARLQSLFYKDKLVFLEHAYEIPAKELARLLGPLVENRHTTVLIEEDKKPEKALGFLLKPPVITKTFDYLEGAEWKRFVSEEAARAGVSLEDGALNFLSEIYAKDSWGLATELQKLSLCGKEKISHDDLEALGHESAPFYWSLVNGLKSSSRGERLRALQELLATGDPAAKIFNLLSALWPAKIALFAAYDSAIKMGKMDYEEALADLATS